MKINCLSLFALLVCLCLLASCGTANFPTDNDDDNLSVSTDINDNSDKSDNDDSTACTDVNDNSGESDNDNDGNNDSNGNSTDDNIDYPISLEQRVTSAIPFGGGYAFVEYGYAWSFVCINQYGETVFTLDQSATPQTSFTNGHALIYKYPNYYLIDTQGNVVEEDNYTGHVGTSNIVEMFNDGYFPVYRAIETFEGTTYEFGVIGTEGKWILELSSSYFDIQNESIMESLVYGYADYIQGHLYLRLANVWVNLNNGSVSSKEPIIPDDVWNGKNGVLKDNNENIKLDISSKYPSLTEVGNFYHNADYTYAVFANGFFSLIDRDGNMLFEPYQITGDIKVDKTGRTFFAVCANSDIVDVYGFDGAKIELLSNSEKGRVDWCSTSVDGYMVRRVYGNTAYSYYFYDNTGKLIIQAEY